MPITYEKEFKRYISSDAYKNLIRRLKLCWAQSAGKFLQMVIHGEIGSQFPFPEATPETHEEKVDHQNQLDKARGLWAFRLDEDTVDFVHCDLCLEALLSKDLRAGAEAVWALKDRTVH